MKPIGRMIQAVGLAIGLGGALWVKGPAKSPNEYLAGFIAVAIGFALAAMGTYVVSRGSEVPHAPK